MAREIVGKGLRLTLRNAPCAHICRYCLIAETRKSSTLPFARFERLAHRFFDWKAASGRDDLGIGVFVGPSYDYDLETIAGMGRLRARRGGEFKILNLGGLRLRDAAALNSWLDERQAAGITGFHVSLAGHGAVHDRWNGRAGDFDYQMTILRLGGERGMVRRERLFLTQNTLPLFDRLLDSLDALPGKAAHRGVSPFFYAGLARRYEDERITEENRDSLPERIRSLVSRHFENWRSEREWIPLMLETAHEPRKLPLKLDVSEANIDRLEAMDCADIFAEQERFYQQDYRRIPSVEELCARYGDRDSRKIYVMSRDVEGRWMDQHQRETGVKIPID
jgi:hypothetical protein